jgi:hypothetical protein
MLAAVLRCHAHPHASLMRVRAPVLVPGSWGLPGIGVLVLVPMVLVLVLVLLLGAGDGGLQGQDRAGSMLRDAPGILRPDSFFLATRMSQLGNLSAAASQLCCSGTMQPGEREMHLVGKECGGASQMRNDPGARFMVCIHPVLRDYRAVLPPGCGMLLLGGIPDAA